MDTSGFGSLLTRRFTGMIALSDREKETLEDLGVRAREFPAQTVLAQAGVAYPAQLLLAGWGCHRQVLKDGRQQIIRFLLPGDMIGSPLRRPRPSLADAIALTRVCVADVRSLQQMLSRPDHGQLALAKAFGRSEHADCIGVIDQITRLGRQSAYGRILHLILELHARLDAIGEVHGGSFRIPLTQEALADALGLSVVHVNRVLCRIRREGLLSIRQGEVKLFDLDLMREKAGWCERTRRSEV